MKTLIEDSKKSLLLMKRQLASSRFLKWWLGELDGLAPGWLRPAGLDIKTQVVIELDMPKVSLGRFDGERIKEFAQLNLKSSDQADLRLALQGELDKARAATREVVLVLRPGNVLRKTLMLPLATEENLRQVLEFQMEQHTPFHADQVYFAYRMVRRDFEKNMLEVEFEVTPRAALSEKLALLGAWGLQTRAVIASDRLALGDAVNLLPESRQGGAFPWPKGVNLWLLGTALALGVVVVAMPLVIERQAILQLLPVVDKAKKAAEATDALRQELESKVAVHNFLLEKKQERPPVIEVLEELSRTLPDDTWVSQLDIKGKELQIQGETAASSKLVGLFEQTKMFHDANFRSPLTKGQGQGAERYHLAIEMNPVPPREVLSPPPGAAAQPQLAVPAAAPAKAGTPAEPFPAPVVSPASKAEPVSTRAKMDVKP